MVDSQDRIHAEAVLGSLLIGSMVNGLRFGVLQLLFDTPAVAGEPYINLASAWAVYPTRPTIFPENELDVPENIAEIELQTAVALRHKVVMCVEVLEPWPHLVLTFTDNSVLYLNGKNDQFEPWTAGLSGVPDEKKVRVIACPGGALAFVLPQGVSANKTVERR